MDNSDEIKKLLAVLVEKMKRMDAEHQKLKEHVNTLTNKVHHFSRRK